MNLDKAAADKARYAAYRRGYYDIKLGPLPDAEWHAMPARLAERIQWSYEHGLCRQDGSSIMLPRGKQYGLNPPKLMSFAAASKKIRAEVNGTAAKAAKKRPVRSAPAAEDSALLREVEALRARVRELESVLNIVTDIVAA